MCKSDCCSSHVCDRIFVDGCDRWWCCFTGCFKLTENFLIDQSTPNDEEKFFQIEEWMRGFSPWPFPWLTTIAILIEVIVYVVYSKTQNYYSALINGHLIFRQDRPLEVFTRIRLQEIWFNFLSLVNCTVGLLIHFVMEDWHIWPWISFPKLF